MITELFAAIMAYAERNCVREIYKLPGCWEFEPGPGWFLAVNAHHDAVDCTKGTKVPPFTAYVEWHGFPAGFITPQDGVLAAGSMANESTLLKALGWNGSLPISVDPKEGER